MLADSRQCAWPGKPQGAVVGISNSRRVLNNSRAVKAKGWHGREAGGGSLRGGCAQRQARHAHAFATTGCRHLASTSQPAFVGCTASVISLPSILLPLMKREPQSTKLSALSLAAKDLQAGGGRGHAPRECISRLRQGAMTAAGLASRLGRSFNPPQRARSGHARRLAVRAPAAAAGHQGRGGAHLSWALSLAMALV